MIFEQKCVKYVGKINTKKWHTVCLRFGGRGSIPREGNHLKEIALRRFTHFLKNQKGDAQNLTFYAQLQQKKLQRERGKSGGMGKGVENGGWGEMWEIGEWGRGENCWEWGNGGGEVWGEMVGGGRNVGNVHGEWGLIIMYHHGRISIGDTYDRRNKEVEYTYV